MRYTFLPRHLVALCAITILLSSAARPAAAQFGLGLGGVVFDPKNLAQSVTNYKKLVDQLTMQTKIYTSQVTALKKLVTMPTRDIRSTISTIDAAMRQGQALGYSLANVDAVFRTTFPETSPAAFTENLLHDRDVRTIATLRSVLGAAQQATATIPDGLARLQQMKTQLTQAVGHEQALEVNGAASVYAAEELALLRQQFAAQMNAQAVYYAQDVARRAQADANERAFFAWLAAPPRQPTTVSFHPDAE